ncbi:hypothetical protein KAU93_04010, partial [Candidatus Bathyarchaeota archaeon]|nr:hypothetical protein [Candidatus Bathyarchaeota archaeon]
QKINNATFAYLIIEKPRPRAKILKSLPPPQWKRSSSSQWLASKKSTRSKAFTSLEDPEDSAPS